MTKEPSLPLRLFCKLHPDCLETEVKRDPGIENNTLNKQSCTFPHLEMTSTSVYSTLSDVLSCFHITLVGPLRLKSKPRVEAHTVCMCMCVRTRVYELFPQIGSLVRF